jgi:hypothetical protein
MALQALVMVWGDTDGWAAEPLGTAAGTAAAAGRVSVRAQLMGVWAWPLHGGGGSGPTALAGVHCSLVALTLTPLATLPRQPLLLGAPPPPPCQQRVLR